MTKPKPRTFDECYKEIEVIVEKKRYSWTLKADLMMDFDDVKNIILAHIWQKWHLYDQKRSLGAWVSRVVKNRFFNILRDMYLSTSSPCSNCPCNLGGDSCSLYGTQGTECELYKKWYNTKRHSHNARLPLPIEHHMNDISQKPETSFDIESAANALHDKIKTVLTDSEWEIYHRLYVLHKDEETTAKELGLKTTEKGRKIGYKRIRQVKTIILSKAKRIIAQEGIETIHG